MSNEKPVRITVGDVKEVTEATTIQADTRVSSVAERAPATVDNGGNGMVMLAGLAGLVLLILAGYFGFGHGVTPAAVTPSSVNAPNSKVDPKATTPSNVEMSSAAANNLPPMANNAPAATNTPAANNAPAASNNASK